MWIQPRATQGAVSTRYGTSGDDVDGRSLEWPNCKFVQCIGKGCTEPCVAHQSGNGMRVLSILRSVLYRVVHRLIHKKLGCGAAEMMRFVSIAVS